MLRVCIPGLVFTGALLVLTSTMVPCHAQTLQEALDDTGLTWITGGAAVWAHQSDVTHDAMDAAQSGIMVDNDMVQESWMETEVTGPGTLSFWWTVSSETDFDTLGFYLDGSLSPYYNDETGQNYVISGLMDGTWEQRSLAIPAGTHTLRWVYSKDESLSEGADMGWVDEVSFIPDEQFPPEIASQPVGLSVQTGDDATLTVDATGAGSLSYQWQKDGTNLVETSRIVGINHYTLLIRSALPSDAGDYSVVVSNPYGDTPSSNAVLTTVASPSLHQSLDAARLVWSTGGDLPWWGRTNTTHDGTDAAQSGNLQDQEESWIETNVRGPGTLSFWWRASSETNFDVGTFATNSVVQTNISGQTGWRKVVQELPAGSHTLRWAYKKDIQTAVGEDRMWLDEVSFVPVPPAVPSTGATKLPDGRFELTITANPGYDVQVWGSTNLTQWDSLGILPNPTGTVVFIDPETNLVHRVYRASVAP